MATFSVDITSVRFAATNTGYKDITITGMPQAGVDCTITGTNASSFGYRIPGDDPNVYRVYSTDHSSLGVSRSAKTATFRITNAGDSSDYVDVSLVQVQYPGYPTIRGGESSNSDELYVDVDGLCFFAYSLSLYTLATIYIDGYEGTATASDSWIYYNVQQAYTDTGFKKVTIGCTNNYNGPQRGNLTLNGTNLNTKVLVYQNGYPSSTSGCTSPINFTDSGGTETVTLKYESGFNPNNMSYFSDNTSSFANFDITKGTSTSTSMLWTITVGSNSGDEIIGVVAFERASTHQYYGHTIIKQASPVPSPTLVASPSVLTYPSTGGGRELGVDYDTTLATNLSSAPSWLGAVYVDVGPSHRAYTITAASNETSVARSWDLELSDVNMSLTVPITQAAGGAASLSVSPTGNSVTSTSGSVQITVNAVGISSVSYSASSWITYTGKSGDVYTFSYTANTSSSQRQGTVTFYGDGLSATYTLTQAASDQPSLVVSPTAESVSSTSGSVQVTVTATNISTVTYSISDSWISYTSESSGVYTFGYTANAGAQRQGVVTFSGGGLSRTYTLTQAAGQTYPTFSVSPSSLSFGAGVCSDYLETSNINNNQLAWNITYNEGSDWMSLNFSNPGMIRVYCVWNSSENSRTATIRLYRITDPSVDYIDVPVTQAGGTWPALTVSPSTANVEQRGGYVSVYVTDGSSAYAYEHTEPSWITVTAAGTPYYWDLTVAANNSATPRTGVVEWVYNNKLGTFTVYQAGADPLVVTPRSVDFGEEGGTSSLDVTFSGTLTYNSSSFPSWLSMTETSSSTGHKVFSLVVPRTEVAVAKTFVIQFEDDYNSVGVRVNQAAGRSTWFTVSDDVLWFEADGTTTGPLGFGIAYRGIAPGVRLASGSEWITLTERAADSTILVTPTVSENIYAEGRVGVVVVEGTDDSKEVVISQAAHTASFSVTPTSLLDYGFFGGVNFLEFSDVPDGGLSWDITYDTGSDWVTITFEDGDTGRVSVVENTSNSARTAYLKFYNQDDEDDYLVIRLVQGGHRIIPIWRDAYYTPLGSEIGENFHYRLVDSVSGKVLFEGISVSPDDDSLPESINVPRLVESYIKSDEDLVLDDSYRWKDLRGELDIDFYNAGVTPADLETSFSFWNDWSRKTLSIDTSKILNDPINGRGARGMQLPFCVYNGPGSPYWFNTSDGSGVGRITFPEVEGFKMVNVPYVNTDEITFWASYTSGGSTHSIRLFTYDMTHCGQGYFVYRNRLGGWDSFLIEGNISKTEGYNKEKFSSPKKGRYYEIEKHINQVDITTSYQATTGWLTDEEAERLVHHLLSSPRVYFCSLEGDRYEPENMLVEVVLTDSSAEYKKFRNGKRLVNYTINFETSNIKQVQR